MQKLETRNGTLLFVEVTEKVVGYDICYESEHTKLFLSDENGTIEYESNKYLDFNIKYELLGEVTKEGITFDCAPYILEQYASQTIKDEYYFMRLLSMNEIFLTEGNKFVVLKERQA